MQKNKKSKKYLIIALIIFLLLIISTLVFFIIFKKDKYIDVGEYIEIKGLRIDYLSCEDFIVPESYLIPKPGTKMAKTKFRYTNNSAESIYIGDLFACPKFDPTINYDSFYNLESSETIEMILQPYESLEFYIYFDLSNGIPIVEIPNKSIYFYIKW